MYMDDERIGGRSALRFENGAAGPRVERISGEAVDCLRGHSYQLTALQGSCEAKHIGGGPAINAGGRAARYGLFFGGAHRACTANPSSPFENGHSEFFNAIFDVGPDLGRGLSGVAYAYHYALQTGAQQAEALRSNLSKKPMASFPSFAASPLRAHPICPEPVERSVENSSLATVGFRKTKKPKR